MFSNQQLRKTELASKTAEINHTPLGKELGLDEEHGLRIDKARRVAAALVPKSIRGCERENDENW